MWIADIEAMVYITIFNQNLVVSRRIENSNSVTIGNSEKIELVIVGDIKGIVTSKNS